MNHLKPAALKQALERNEALLIDVREPGEYAREHIAGAQSLPVSAFDVAKLPRDRKIVLCCHSGMRSTRALAQLQAAGFNEVAHLDGGMAAWKEAGLTTSVSIAQPISMLRQVQLVAGSIALLGVILALLVSPAFIWLAGAIGAGLVYSGLTDTCPLSHVLALLPYNRPRT